MVLCVPLHRVRLYAALCVPLHRVPLYAALCVPLHRVPVSPGRDGARGPPPVMALFRCFNYASVLCYKTFPSSSALRHSNEVGLLSLWERD